MLKDAIAFDGFEVGIDLDRWPAKILRALLRRHYEKHELRLVSRLLDPGDRVIELGSAIGVVALAASRTVPPEQIACFDANPEMVAAATANFQRNGKPVTARNAVLVADPSAPPTMTFYKTPYFLSSSLSADTAGSSPVEVPTLQLVEAISKRGANVLIVDIEGGEFDLLGAADLGAIEKLVLELHVSMAGVAACLKLVSDLRRQGLELDATLTGHNVFVFTRAGRGSLPQAERDAFAAAYLEGLEKSDAGDGPGAADAVARAIDANPGNAHAHLLLSQLMTREHPTGRALEAADTAARLDPQNEDTFEQLGVLHTACGADEEAERAYSRAIELVPHRPLFHAGLGTVRIRQGLKEEAIAAFETAARLCPVRATTMKHILDLAVRQDKAPDETVPDMAGDAPRNIDPAALLRTLADVVGGGFRFPDAANALRCALEGRPGDQALHCALAALVATPKDIRKALTLTTTI